LDKEYDTHQNRENIDSGDIPKKELLWFGKSSANFRLHPVMAKQLLIHQRQ
jgi:hypothetical protein